MFLLNGKVIQPGSSFTDVNGTQYPPQWLYQTTLAQKQAIGITEVPDPVRADDRFYWDGNIDNPKDLKELKEYHIKQVKETAGKLLAQTDWQVLRKFERSLDIEPGVIDQRAYILAEANRLESEIKSASNVETLISVLNDQKWEM
jgi:hypothetical protein